MVPVPVWVRDDGGTPPYMDTRQLHALRATAAAAQGATSVDGYCQAVIGHMASLLGTSRCSVLLVGKGHHFHHAAAIGLDSTFIQAIDGLEISGDLGTCGPTITSGRPTLSPDLADDPRWDAVRELIEQRELRACWSVPLRAGTDAPLGSLGIYHVRTGMPTAEQLAVAETIADILALGIDGIRHQQTVARGSAATVQALMSALDARDAYTSDHCAATSALAVAVGTVLGLDAGGLSTLQRTAELHDVGKLAIPDAVLHKPAHLDEGEAAVMRTHPVVGARIVEHVPGLEEVARAVRHEHERWDGRGYPDGLAGEAIPIASRIVFACDAFHAMTSDRPYRRALPADDARAELRRHAGSQFDPEVVAALLAVLSASPAAR